MKYRFRRNIYVANNESMSPMVQFHFIKKNIKRKDTSCDCNLLKRKFCSLSIFFKTKSLFKMVKLVLSVNVLTIEKQQHNFVHDLQSYFFLTCFIGKLNFGFQNFSDWALIG